MLTGALPLSLNCPRCGSDAFYGYGHTRNGKQRYLCLVCKRQFSDGAKPSFSQRPVCPRCQAKMHVYMQEAAAVRFRCSNYPHCREYIKVDKENPRP
jgi:transposase-like protein